MADRAQPVTRAWPGAVSALGLFLFLAIPVVAVIWVSGDWRGLRSSDWAAIRFTLVQAGLSAVLSTLLAVPVARALAGRNFPGRSFLVLLLGAPFILPVIVAAMGLLAILGRNGLISDAFSLIGLPRISIYGLHGVVIAHIFLNLPLATRLLLSGWNSVPGEAFRLGASLNFDRGDYLRIIERPMLWRVVPGTLLVIFVICISSFAIALLLGGGPKATTIELAIYQAFRFDFDLARAAQLALIQLGLCTCGALAIGLIGASSSVAEHGLDRPPAHWAGQTLWLRLVDGFWIVAASLFLVLPLMMIVANGSAGIFDLPQSVVPATVRSLVVAGVSTTVAVGLGLVLAISIGQGRRKGRKKLSALFELIGFLSISISPLVIGTGLFIVIFPYTSPTKLALAVTALVNAAMALPFVLRSLIPAATQVETTYGRLADALSLSGLARLRFLYLPRMRRETCFAAGLAAALSIGDLGVITLFATSDAPTLPMLIYRLMGAYQMEAAAGAALLLMITALGVFWLLDRGGRLDA